MPNRAGSVPMLPGPLRCGGSGRRGARCYRTPPVPACVDPDTLRRPAYSPAPARTAGRVSLARGMKTIEDGEQRPWPGQAEH